MENKEERWAPLESLPEKELKEVLFGLLDGRIYSSAHSPKQLDMVFLPIAMGAFEGAPKEWLDQIGLIYEWLHEASPRSLNGHPMFFSMRLLNKTDWERILPLLQEEERRRKDLKL